MFNISLRTALVKVQLLEVIVSLRGATAVARRSRSKPAASQLDSSLCSEQAAQSIRLPRSLRSLAMTSYRRLPNAELLSTFLFPLFLFCIFCSCAYADLNRAEALYLSGSYSASIDECAINIARDNAKDKAYYLLGLNYLKINDTEKAKEKLKILLENYRASPYFDSAKLAYADTYFMEQDYARAQILYEDIIKNNSKLAAGAYLRLGQCALKAGNWETARSYAGILQQKYPLSLEAQVSKELSERQDFFFTVQVGSFASLQNAKRLLNKLRQKNFDGYIDELNSPQGQMYRVRVGKFSERQKAENLKNILEAAGYPTRIFP